MSAPLPLYVPRLPTRLSATRAYGDLVPGVRSRRAVTRSRLPVALPRRPPVLRVYVSGKHGGAYLIARPDGRVIETGPRPKG
jgi:hypothetical protein